MITETRHVSLGRRGKSFSMGTNRFKSHVPRLCRLRRSELKLERNTCATVNSRDTYRSLRLAASRNCSVRVAEARSGPGRICPHPKVLGRHPHFFPKKGG